MPAVVAAETGRFPGVLVIAAGGFFTAAVLANSEPKLEAMSGARAAVAAFAAGCPSGACLPRSLSGRLQRMARYCSDV